MNPLKLITRIKVKRGMNHQIYLSILAGMCISIGCIGLAFIRSDSPLPYAFTGVLSGLIFSFGLFTIFALGFELFTGNCLLMSSYFAGEISFRDLCKVLGYTLLGNLIGCVWVYIIFIMCNLSYADILRVMANAKIDLPLIQLFARGILCNIVICLATLINYQCNGVINKFASACIPVIIFVACGFEHSIADFFILLFSTLSPVRTFLCFAAVLLGNVVGGALVAFLHYAVTYENPYCKEHK